MNSSVWAEDAVDLWKRSVSLGYTLSSGNTEKSELSAAVEAKKTTSSDELQFKADLYNSRSSGQTDGQKWGGMTHYSYNVGEKRVWFGSGQVTVGHDKFANVDYRVSPALGLGRWFSKADDGNTWDAYAEELLGYEVTEYINGENEEQPVAITHVFGEKKFWADSKISQDLSITPSLKENQVRVKSETAFVTLLKTNLSLSSRFIYEYDSKPAPDAKDTDTRWITGIKYDF